MLDSLWTYDQVWMSNLFLWLPESVISVAGFLTDPTTWIIPGVILYLRYLMRFPGEAFVFLVLFLMTLGISDYVIQFLKEQAGRNRPTVWLGVYANFSVYSFPSAHAGNSIAMAIVSGVWLPAYRRSFIWGAIAIGVLRIAGLHHFPSDVAAGFITGMITGGTIAGILAIATGRFRTEGIQRPLPRGI